MLQSARRVAQQGIIHLRSEQKYIDLSPYGYSWSETKNDLASFVYTVVMATEARPKLHSQELLDDQALWDIHENYYIPDDLHRYCKANEALDVKRGEVIETFGVIVSAGCSHIAAIQIIASRRTINVTVYHLKNGFEKSWIASYVGSEDEFSKPDTGSTYDRDRLQGGITEDGQNVLLIHINSVNKAQSYIINVNGFTRRTTPPGLFSTYTLTRRVVSEDSEYLFFKRD